MMLWYVTDGIKTAGPFESDLDANEWMNANTDNEHWELYHEGDDNV
jgi:hypothetical protein